MQKVRTVIHVDLNSFFATAEQQTNPALRGKPVGVVKAKGRACIIAASVEAKKYGVSTGSNVYDAKKLCPSIILVNADFEKYEDISYRFIKICKTYSWLCEVFSLDECFIDVSETEKFFGGVLSVAFDLKRRLREEVGDYMSCSVGISHNRLLAKLASEQIKPDGLFFISEANMLDVLDKSQLMDVCGLGWGLNRHLLGLGIDSFAKLRTKSMEFLQQNFGPFWSVHLYNICRGIDDSPVGASENLPDAKSVSRTYTTHHNLTKKSDVLRLVRNLCEETAAKARAMRLAGRYVGLALRGGVRGDFDTSGGGWRASQNYDLSWYGHRTLKNYVDDGKALFDLCKIITKDWDYCQRKDSYVRFCGVTLGMLTSCDYVSAPLFPWDRKRRVLINSVDSVNGKWGDYTLFPARLLGMPIIRPEVTGYFGDKKYRLEKQANW